MSLFTRLRPVLARRVCAALALQLAVGAAWAADPVPKSPKAAEPRRGQAPAPAQAKPKPIEPLLTRDELRACMSLQARNRQLAVEAPRLQGELGARKDELKQEGDTLKADLAALDRTSPEAVAGYNARVAERERQIGELERRIAEFNQMAQTFEEGRASYARDCENRKFDERDEKAILSGS